jgi:hypothetical protein
VTKARGGTNLPGSVIPRESGESMDIKSQEWNSAYAKLTLKRVQDLKVQMEELQWGFPIATTLSLNKLISINGK